MSYLNIVLLLILIGIINIGYFLSIWYEQTLVISKISSRISRLVSGGLGYKVVAYESSDNFHEVIPNESDFICYSLKGFKGKKAFQKYLFYGYKLNNGTDKLNGVRYEIDSGLKFNDDVWIVSSTRIKPFEDVMKRGEVIRCPMILDEPVVYSKTGRGIERIEVLLLEVLKGYKTLLPQDYIIHLNKSGLIVLDLINVDLFEYPNEEKGMVVSRIIEKRNVILFEVDQAKLYFELLDRILSDLQ